MTTDALTVQTPQVLDRTEPAVIITGDQINLIKQTIAAEASDAELALFFYDCRRRGVHPLDKLIHFTKRKGKYTPVTSIDFFRSRAGRTGEHMGTDDAVFTGEPRTDDFAATVTVYRLVQGERCAFTATARWPEYCPEDEKNAFMWNKMPHGQLAKCAESLALRKGFPQELEGLHTIEEMDQSRAADEPRAKAPMQAPQRKAAKPATNTVTGHVQRFGPEKKGTGNKGAWTKYSIQVDGKYYGTFDEKHRDIAKEAQAAGLDVVLEFKETEYGLDIVKIAAVEPPAAANGQLPIEREVGQEG